MRKIFLVTIVVGLLAVAIYYGSFFVRDTEVNELAPELMDEMKMQDGEFGEIDAVHKGSGKAILIRQGDERILRFENFKVTNGPDLYVYLVTSDKPTHENSSLGEFINLGRLKGNVGDQNYEFKTTDFPDKNLDEYDTAVVWCRQFGVLFTFANLK